MSRYRVIIEKTATGFSAYSPDLPGCVATGHTRKEVKKEMHDAIEFHIKGSRLAASPQKKIDVAKIKKLVQNIRRQLDDLESEL